MSCGRDSATPPVQLPGRGEDRQLPLPWPGAPHSPREAHSFPPHTSAHLEPSLLSALHLASPFKLGPLSPFPGSPPSLI